MTRSKATDSSNASRRVGIRELKAGLSRFLRRVEAGEALTITDRGKPIARLLPASISPDERMRAMVAAGLAQWSGEALRLEPFEPLLHIDNEQTASEMLLEDRR